jgi:hypothetical protein
MKTMLASPKRPFLNDPDDDFIWGLAVAKQAQELAAREKSHWSRSSASRSLRPSDVTTVLRRGSLVIRLQATTGAMVATKDGPKPGSVLDIDARFGPLDADLFGKGLERFGQAHHAIKGFFFGLSKPELLAKFSFAHRGALPPGFESNGFLDVLMSLEALARGLKARASSSHDAKSRAEASPSGYLV